MSNTNTRNTSRLVAFVVLFFAILLLDFGAVNAGVVPGRWDKLETIQPGTELRLETKSAGLLIGFYEGVLPDAVRFTVDGRSQVLPKTDILKIYRTKKDSNLNGTLIGLLAGLGVGFSMSYKNDAEATAILHLITVPVGLGAGATVGYLVDRSVHGKEVIYSAR